MLSDKKLISLTLKEDIGSGDITTKAILGKKKTCTAKLLSKEDGILCGTQWFSSVFSNLSKKIQIQWNKKDGDPISKGNIICQLNGPASFILMGERTALNLLQHLSAIATKTHQTSSLLKNSSIKLLDTRKTLPLIRKYEKIAVKTGGGENHRFGLYDLFLIKENHIAVAGSLTKAVNLCKKYRPQIKIEVETTTMAEVQEAVKTQADIIMLDNMDNETIMQAALYIKSKTNKKIEVSGNMTKERVETLKDYPIDFISMGSLIHSVKAFDFSLLIEWKEKID